MHVQQEIGCEKAPIAQLSVHPLCQTFSEINIYSNSFELFGKIVKGKHISNFYIIH